MATTISGSSGINTQGVTSSGTVSGATVTSSGNASITGTVTADGLTVDTDTLHVDATNNRVGIGTSSPVGELNVNGTTFLGGSGQSLAIYQEGTGVGIEAVDPSNTTTKKDMWFNAYGGNVGIGTSSPAYKLDVVGNVDGSHVSRVNNISTGSTSQSFFQLVAGGRYTNLRTNYTGRYFQISGSNIENFYQDFDTHFFRNSAGTNTMVINSSGHVTKPDQPLFVGRFDYVTTTASNYVIGVSQIYNRSMSFNATNDRITVPTSGYYLIHAQQLYQSSGGIYLEARVNGATIVHGFGSMGTNHRDLVSNAIWYLNANDYVDFHLRNTSIYTWGGPHSLCYVQLVQ